MGLFSKLLGKNSAAEDVLVREAQVIASTEEEEDQDEIVAVIAATVTALSGGAQIIQIFRRELSDRVPYWALASRQEMMDSRKF